MASVELTLSGVFYDKLARTSRPGVFIGEGHLTGLGVGGGPMPPGPGEPPGIWGGGNEGFPTPPIYLPPEFGGGGGGGSPPQIWPGRPAHPIVLPPEQVPPELKPPTPPPAGTTTPVPPPAGSAGWPVAPITPPAYVVLQYPGVGPIYVTPPISAAATKK